MMPRRVVAAGLLLTLLLVLLACTGSSHDEGIPPCTPVEGAEREPCDDRAIESPTFGGSRPAPLGDAPGSFAFPDADVNLGVPHLFVRATFHPNTTRCTAGNPFRPADHQFELSGHGAPGFLCFIDVRANEYYLGSGPSRLTVLTWRFEYGYDPHPEPFRQSMEAMWANWLEGREYVFGLGPSFDVGTEVLQIFGLWKVVRKADGTVVAYHPKRDRWLEEKPAVAQANMALLEMTLPTLAAAVDSAHQDRVDRFDGRIGAAADLPMLVTDASNITEYYEDVGAYDDGAVPSQPPPVPER